MTSFQTPLSDVPPSWQDQYASDEQRRTRKSQKVKTTDFDLLGTPFNYSAVPTFQMWLEARAREKARARMPFWSRYLGDPPPGYSFLDLALRGQVECGIELLEVQN